MCVRKQSDKEMIWAEITQKTGLKGNLVQINVDITNDHCNEIREEVFLEVSLENEEVPEFWKTINNRE